MVRLILLASPATSHDQAEEASVNRRGRFLLATWDGSGNLAATLALVVELQRRGHQVRVLGHSVQRERVEREQVAFRAYESAPPWMITATDWRTKIVEDVWLHPGTTADLQEAARQFEAEVLLVDCMLLAALMSRDVGSLPTAILVHTLGGFMARDWTDRVLTRVNGFRAERGLSVVTSAIDLWREAELVLMLTLKEFDDLGRDELPRMRYVGPVFTRHGRGVELACRGRQVRFAHHGRPQRHVRSTPENAAAEDSRRAR